MNNRIITIIWITLISSLSTLLSGQTEVMDSVSQWNLVKVTMKKATDERSTDALDQLINSKVITIPLFKSYLQTTKAKIAGNNLIRNLKNYNAIEKRRQIQIVIQLYNIPNNNCSECLQNSLNEKANFLDKVHFKEVEYYRTLFQLDSLGFKPSKYTPAAIGLTFMGGQNSQWLGLRGCFGRHSKTSNKNAVSKTIYNTVTVQYLKNITQKGYEWTIGFFDIEGPYFANILKFGYGSYAYRYSFENTLFYRPELGFNIYGFQFAYGHSFRLAGSSIIDRDHLILRYTF